MSTKDLETRFGDEAARAVSELIGSPSIGGPRPVPAARDRARGALIGAAVGETLGLPVVWLGREEIAARFGRITGHIGRAEMGEDSLLALITADSVLAGPVDHPARFARRLTGMHRRFASRATGAARRALREGAPWWSAAEGSAGTAAAARCIVFGLRWAGDPRRAAYEAALSAAVTHRHPAAVSAAAAVAAGIALAAGGSGPLDSAWLEEAADICSGFAQRAVGGVRVDARLKQMPRLSSPKADGSRTRRAEEPPAQNGPLATEAVPAAFWCAVNARSPEDGVLAAVNAGGDADTIAAMAGAFLGARYGEKAWPAELTRIDRLGEMTDTADRLSRPPAEPVAAAEPVGAAEQAATAEDAPVHVSFLVDRSGSMQGLEADVVGGFNQFAAEQRRQPGDCRLTLVQFDSQDPFEVIHDARPLAEVDELTLDRYQPRGTTPLLDALGALIESVDRRLDERGGSAEDQVLVVFTDGLENASRRWSRSDLFAAVEQRKQAGWSFVFMGANQDSYLEAGRLGFERGNIQNYEPDARGTASSFRSFSRAAASYRRSSSQRRRTRSTADYFEGVKEAEEDQRRRRERQ